MIYQMLPRPPSRLSRGFVRPQTSDRLYSGAFSTRLGAWASRSLVLLYQLCKRGSAADVVTSVLHKFYWLSVRYRGSPINFVCSLLPIIIVSCGHHSNSCSRLSITSFFDAWTTTKISCPELSAAIAETHLKHRVTPPTAKSWLSVVRCVCENRVYTL